jgi:hypothetical protein
MPPNHRRRIKTIFNHFSNTLARASIGNYTNSYYIFHWTNSSGDGTIVSGPSNSTNYMNLTWDYNNTTVNPKQTVRVTLTLSIDNSDNFIWFLINNNVTQFSFDIIISANESR